MSKHWSSIIICIEIYFLIEIKRISFAFTAADPIVPIQNSDRTPWCGSSLAPPWSYSTCSPGLGLGGRSESWIVLTLKAINFNLCTIMIYYKTWSLVSNSSLRSIQFWNFVFQKVIFHQRLSSIEGPLPLKVVFNHMLSSIKGHLSSLVVIHQRSSSIKGRLTINGCL